LAAASKDLVRDNPRADPARAAERAARPRTTQDVFSFDSEDGLKTIVAKAAAGDATWFLATVNRLAEILAADGDTDPIGARCARAVGILAQPAEALRLLLEHHHDSSDKSNEHIEPTEVAPIDGYEVPQRLRAAVRTLPSGEPHSRNQRQSPLS
jgi:hypothetical protein